MTVLSSEPVSSQLPSFEKLTERTVPVCAFNKVERPSLHRQRYQRTVIKCKYWLHNFKPGVALRWHFKAYNSRVMRDGLTRTFRSKQGSGGRYVQGAYTVGCHKRTVLSLEPEAMRGWVGENATE